MKVLSTVDTKYMRIIWDLCENKDRISNDDIEEQLLAARRISGENVDSLSEIDRREIFNYTKRLKHKGFLKAERTEKDKRLNVYTVLIQREEYIAEQNKALIRQLYNSKSAEKDYYAALVEHDKDVSRILAEIQQEREAHRRKNK